jgi:aminopeptidase N
MVSRIDDVIALQNRQFKEDAGPMAHAVLPADYETTENIYSMTIYRKGAELINMLRTLIGKDTYKKGCNLYFAEHDGKAANIEDFLAAMEKASHRNLSQFLLWYQQVGTPQLEIEDNYDEITRTYSLTISQTCIPTPGQPNKQPLLIPIEVALYSHAGEELALQLSNEQKTEGSTRILELTEKKQTFTFVGINEKPVPSLLRNFSAPVKITKSPVTRANNIFLLEHDSDPINRWLAAQNISKDAIQSIITDIQSGKIGSVDANIINAFRAALLDQTIEPRLKSQLINFPPIDSFFDFMKPADPAIIYHARELFINSFIDGCYDVLKSTYETLASTQTASGYEPQVASLRCLKNTCLDFLIQSNTPEATNFCRSQLAAANNMTDRLGALAPLAINHHEERIDLRDKELNKFVMKWKQEQLVLEHIFKLYAYNNAPNAIEQIKQVYNSSFFDKENPSHSRNLLYRFYNYNPLRFHDATGVGYKFIADCIIELDKINPSTASDLAAAFSNWKTLEPIRQGKMLEQLFRLNDLPLSDNVKEIISKSAKDALDKRASVALVKNPQTLFKTVGPESKQEESLSLYLPQQR